MPGFADRVRNYAAQKDSKVNPPEAQQVLETKAAPEVANAAPPAAAAAAPEPSVSSEAAPAASTETPTEGKARRGRPAGSKNAPKPPAEPAATAPGSSQFAEGNSLADAINLVRDLLPAGTTVTISKV